MNYHNKIPKCFEATRVEIKSIVRIKFPEKRETGVSATVLSNSHLIRQLQANIPDIQNIVRSCDKHYV